MLKKNTIREGDVEGNNVADGLGGLCSYVAMRTVVLSRFKALNTELFPSDLIIKYYPNLNEQ